MGSQSINGPQSQAPINLLAVWFEGSTALVEGQGVCYNWDYGTAATRTPDRMNRVELPTILNARYFAGVVDRAYSANTGGQLIYIYGPGSTCNIAIVSGTTTTVIGVGVLTCQAGGTYAGYFTRKGFPGEGTAVPLQTVDQSPASALCLARLQVGEPSGLVEIIATNDDGLLDGGATTFMVGGVSYTTADMSTSGDAVFTLVDGVIPGQRKAFVSESSQSNDVDITVSSGVQGVGNADPTTTLVGIELDADTEEVTLEWVAFDAGGLWVVQHVYGADLANS